jgi:hypothetical protein
LPIVYDASVVPGRLLKIPDQRIAFIALANSDGLSRRRNLGDRGDVLKSPAALLFLKWYLNGKRL